MSEDTTLAPLDPGGVSGLLEQPHHYCMAIFSMPTLDSFCSHSWLDMKDTMN